MGIFSALSTAVSGLRAQSFALENISGNIANSQTIGYKRSDTSFLDLISADGPAAYQTAGSVRALTRSSNSVQGSVQNSDIATNMAINGDGYFIVGAKAGSAGGGPVFGAESLYTRRGDFSLDKSGYLVNGAGYYLKALPVDPATGSPSSGMPVPVQLTKSFLAAKPTQTITYRANLPQFPLTSQADASVPGSELLPAGLIDGTGPAGTSISGDEQSSFLSNSISGGAVTAYDANGNPVSLQLRWGKVSDSPATWNLFYQSNTSATGTDTAYQNVGTTFTFDSAGQLTSPTGGSVSLAGVSVNGVGLGDVTMNLGAKGLTQYADAGGAVQVNALTQDGYAAGEVISVGVTDGGHVVANYSNGQTLEIARVVLATFNGQDSLQKRDGGAFAETLDSGPPILGGSAEITGSATEASNTDIASEFSKLIVTQQAYSANTRIVSTADQMMQEALGMKR
ncbi:flagellar hook protein FlgE [Labrys wisconsinensis]|uniref:Flagellar hook protein FlgE n=1 Tax=Labrys wisconsinensis TaxID=425677 RepID=A0ABU0JIF5_9HYPH|nr:flagellar hook protein FlgE [Labrys wisconsinensis]MDQ0473054.1 flagellar hook protein FlgE [Labrys wisconsinensis]